MRRHFDDGDDGARTRIGAIPLIPICGLSMSRRFLYAADTQTNVCPATEPRYLSLSLFLCLSLSSLLSTFTPAATEELRTIIRARARVRLAKIQRATCASDRRACPAGDQTATRKRLSECYLARWRAAYAHACVCVRA